jgi:hypothetical protein
MTSLAYRDFHLSQGSLVESSPGAQELGFAMLAQVPSHSDRYPGLTTWPIWVRGQILRSDEKSAERSNTASRFPAAKVSVPVGQQAAASAGTDWAKALDIPGACRTTRRKHPIAASENHILRKWGLSRRISTLAL